MAGKGRTMAPEASCLHALKNQCKTGVSDFKAISCSISYHCMARSSTPVLFVQGPVRVFLILPDGAEIVEVNLLNDTSLINNKT